MTSIGARSGLLPLFARLSLLLIGLFAAALSIVRMQPQQAFINFGDCAFPCWQGVQPGVTPKPDALARLNKVMGFPSFQARCSPRSLIFCERYTWMPMNATALAADMQIVPGQSEVIVVYNPGFTVGEALLTLSHLQVDFNGSSEGFEASRRFYLQLLFADSSLVLRAAAVCPGAYLDVIEAPVSSMEVFSSRLNTAFTAIPLVGLRKSYHQLCGVPE